MRGPEKKAKIAWAFAGLAAVLCAACSSAPLDKSTPNESGGGGPGTEPSSTEEEDSGTTEPSLKPSGCPESQVVAPGDLPNGFLAPQKVTLVRVVDGDTAHFKFAKEGEQVVRFLYVNTEETHDARTTDFGFITADKVKAYLEGASEIVVAVEEDKKKPGQPHVDTYGRRLATVFVDGDLFERRLVREGWSAYYTQFGCASNPIHDALVWAEAEARANERGIWKPGHPTDYSAVLKEWMGSSACRPNPYKGPYCK